jgi:hypothetical protein
MQKLPICVRINANDKSRSPLSCIRKNQPIKFGDEMGSIYEAKH